jgi:hypothetical protein
MLEANIALTCACATFLPTLWKDQKFIFSRIGSAFRSWSHGSMVKSKNSSHTKSGAERDCKPNDALVLPAYLRSNASKGRKSDVALVLPHHLDLPESVHIKSERSDSV